MLKEFIQKYYIDSIVYKTGYNPINTLTWITILLIAIIILFKFLKNKVAFDEKFVYSNIPYIIFGASLRIYEDAGFITPPFSYLFMTPMIYIIVFLLTFPTLIVSIKIKGERYWIYHSIVGLIISIPTLVVLFLKLNIENLFVFPTVVTLASGLTLLYLLISKFVKHMNNKLSLTVFFAHMLDCSSTYVGVQYLGYRELHVLPRYLISMFGPWIMIPIKFTIFLILLYLLDKEKDNQLKNFLKFVLIVLGLAPALRNSLRMTFNC
ncbi:MAG TPA: DUF63 family protein [Archaeoglobus profundus]|nr:DUF63 family protein [Archaeoglobus profundus]